MSIKNISSNIFNIMKISNNKAFNSTIVRNIISNYNNDEWKEFTKKTNNIHRNKIISNELLDIYIISWNKYYKSNTHYHTDGGCWFKVLDGKLEQLIHSNSYIYSNFLNKNDVFYIDNKIGPHSIKNIGNKHAYTLHIYSKYM